MHDPLRGVNLGGWLIMERWMTPTPFAGTTARDEYSFMSLPDAAERLEAHRRSWITEEDFRWMAENGLNAVRIPVGYWVLDGDAPYIAAGEYLDWAMEMAAKYELQVVLDVHGLPGSQNGLDHSGRIGKTEWYTDRRNRIKGLAAVEKIAWRYRDHPNLWGFQIINEPKMGLFNLKLRRYYHRAYARLSQVLRPSTRLIYSDAWTPRLLAGIWRRDGARRGHGRPPLPHDYAHVALAVARLVLWKVAPPPPDAHAPVAPAAHYRWRMERYGAWQTFAENSPGRPPGHN
jgi:glucan 1,3-beta-glucosidase